MPHTNELTAALGPSLLSVQDVADFLAVDRSTVYRLAQAGDLLAIQVMPRLLRFRPSDLRAFLEHRRRPPPPKTRVLRLLGDDTSALPLTSLIQRASAGPRPGSRKRRRRFGSIWVRDRPSGRRSFGATWMCKVERRRVTRCFDTEQEAKDFLDTLWRRLLSQQYEPPPTLHEVEQHEDSAKAAATPRVMPALLDYAEHVIERRLDPTLSDGTMGTYRAALTAWKQWFGARDGRPALRLDDIGVSTWLDYRAWRIQHRNSTYGTKTSVGNRTLNSDLHCLSRVLNEAVAQGLIDKNPLAGTKKLKEARRPRRYLTKAELGLLVEHADPGFKPLLVAAVYTGARKSELLALRWQDIDFERGKIALFRRKVGNSDLLDLHPQVRAELERIRDERRPPPEESVFVSPHGTAWVEIRRGWNRALKGAGLLGREGITFHSLRHSFATHFLEGGGSVTDLMAQLGHASLATTQIYAASLSARRRASVLALDFQAAAGQPPSEVEDTRATT
jgi:excisionase family DNA binding protein